MVNLEFFNIIVPTVFHQRFKLGTNGSNSQCYSTELSWDLYVKSGDNVFTDKGRPNEIGESWCLADHIYDLFQEMKSFSFSFIYYTPEVSSMKYCGLEVFRKKYFVLGTSGNNTNRKTALKYLKPAISNLRNFGNEYNIYIANVSIGQRKSGEHLNHGKKAQKYT